MSENLHMQNIFWNIWKIMCDVYYYVYIICIINTFKMYNQYMFHTFDNIVRNICECIVTNTFKIYFKCIRHMSWLYVPYTQDISGIYGLCIMKYICNMWSIHYENIGNLWFITMEYIGN